MSKKSLYKFISTHPIVNNFVLKTKEIVTLLDRRRFRRFQWRSGAENKRIVIIASIFPFSESRQRPQQIALALAKKYPEILFIYYEGDLGCWTFRSRYITPNLLSTNNLSHLRRYIRDYPITLLSEVFHYYRFIRSICPIQVYIFDYIDNLELYSINLLEDLKNNIHRPDKILVTGKKLREQIQSFGRKEELYYIPNGVSTEDWYSAGIEQNPFLGKGTRTIGYYGMIEEWMDFNLLEYIVSQRPKYFFVFIGRDHGKLLQKHGILSHSNVSYIGYVPYQELKRYSSYFDVGIIPFLVNPMTDAVSPVKFFEYLAQGMSVVSTDFYEMKQFSSIATIAHTYDEFMAGIDAEKRDIDLVKEYAKKYEWNSLISNIL